jgi:membrane peptidoglycan carboxypeptidase
VSLQKMLSPHAVPNGCSQSKEPFFCDYVQHEFLSDSEFGATRKARRTLLESGGLTIRTTLVPRNQRGAQLSVDRIPGDDPSKVADAIAMVQPGTGNIQAMAQNRQWGAGGKSGRTTINYATDHSYGGSNGFQAGSTFKIFTLAAAFEKGFPLSTTINAPQTRTWYPSDFPNCSGKPSFLSSTGYQVSNSTGSGTFNIPDGTALSVNTFFVELERRVGLCAITSMADRLGMRQASDGMRPSTALARGLFGPSFTLGTFNTSPLTLANAYATMAARGKYCRPRAILAVHDRDGRPLPVPDARCNQVVDPAVADTVNKVLAGVIDGPNPFRTGQAMSLGRPAGGKTGTIDDHEAVWFAGYTPDLAAAVWVGNPDAPRDHPLTNITIGGTYYSEVFGLSLPGPIWKSAMLTALKGVPPTAFVPPGPINAKVSKNAVVVPSVAGMSTAEALQTLAKAGLDGVVSDTPINSGYPYGVVAGSNPRAGTAARRGSIVTVYLSSGIAPPTHTPTPTATSSPRQSSTASPSPSPTTSGHGNGNGNGNGHGNGNGNGH